MHQKVTPSAQHQATGQPVRGAATVCLYSIVYNIYGADQTTTNGDKAQGDNEYVEINSTDQSIMQAKRRPNTLFCNAHPSGIPNGITAIT